MKKKILITISLLLCLVLTGCNLLGGKTDVNKDTGSISSEENKNKEKSTKPIEKDEKGKDKNKEGSETKSEKEEKPTEIKNGSSNKETKNLQKNGNSSRGKSQLSTNTSSKSIPKNSTLGVKSSKKVGVSGKNSAPAKNVVEQKNPEQNPNYYTNLNSNLEKPIVDEFIEDKNELNSTNQGGNTNETPEEIDKRTIINVPDENLKKVLNKNIDSNRVGTEDITKYDIERLRELSWALNADGSANFGESSGNAILESTNLSGTSDFKFAVTRGIKNIEGLQYAINLEKIKLSDNEIKDLTPLANLNKLVYLDLHRNRIKDVAPLRNLTELKSLDLYNNLIENVEPLSALTNLTFLDLHYNVAVAGNESNKIISDGIVDISPLATLTKLETFSFSDNRVKTIDAVKNMTNMKALDFVNNKVNDYTLFTDEITTLLQKMMEGESGYSIGFAGQNVDYEGIITIDSNEKIITSPYLGIKELQEKLAEAFGAQDLSLFENIETNLEGITATYNKDDNTIKLQITDEALTRYANSSQTMSMKLYTDDFSWKINNVNLKFE